jgi:hypothetical protein
MTLREVIEQYILWREPMAPSSRPGRTSYVTSSDLPTRMPPATW